MSRSDDSFEDLLGVLALGLVTLTAYGLYRVVKGFAGFAVGELVTADEILAADDSDSEEEADTQDTGDYPYHEDDEPATPSLPALCAHCGGTIVRVPRGLTCDSCGHNYQF